MANDERPPHLTVKVNFDNDDYVNACDHFGGGFELLEKWKALGDLLAHRSGWHFDIVNDGEALWSLGPVGQSLLNIHVNEHGGFHCFDYIEDESVTLETIAEIEEWLDHNNREDQRNKPTKLALEIASDQDWSILKSMDFELDVTWLDGWFMGGVSNLPQQPVFAETIPALVQNGRMMIAQYFGAPESVASQLQGLSIRLDRVAVAHLSRDD